MLGPGLEWLTLVIRRFRSGQRKLGRASLDLRHANSGVTASERGPSTAIPVFLLRSSAVKLHQVRPSTIHSTVCCIQLHIGSYHLTLITLSLSLPILCYRELSIPHHLVEWSTVSRLYTLLRAPDYLPILRFDWMQQATVFYGATPPPVFRLPSSVLIFRLRLRLPSPSPVRLGTCPFLGLIANYPGRRVADTDLK